MVSYKFHNIRSRKLQFQQKFRFHRWKIHSVGTKRTIKLITYLRISQHYIIKLSANNIITTGSPREKKLEPEKARHASTDITGPHPFCLATTQCIKCYSTNEHIQYKIYNLCLNAKDTLNYCGAFTIIDALCIDDVFL